MYLKIIITRLRICYIYQKCLNYFKKNDEVMNGSTSLHEALGKGSGKYTTCDYTNYKATLQILCTNQ